MIVDPDLAAAGPVRPRGARDERRCHDRATADRRMLTAAAARALAPARDRVLALPLACALPACPSRYLILTEIAIAGAVRAVARPDPRLCRHRLARPCGVLRHRRLCGRAAGASTAHRRAAAGAGRRRPRRRPSLGFVTSFLVMRGVRPDAADGDAGRRAAAGASWPNSFTGSPAAPTACRASRWSRSSACSSSTCSARSASSTAWPCCSSCSCWRGASCIRRSACRCARSADNPLRAAAIGIPVNRAAGRGLHARRPLCRHRRRAAGADHARSPRSTCSRSTARPTCCWCWSSAAPAISMAG